MIKRPDEIDSGRRHAIKIKPIIDVAGEKCFGAVRTGFVAVNIALNPDLSFHYYTCSALLSGYHD
jgi:hypothetical protein